MKHETFDLFSWAGPDGSFELSLGGYQFPAIQDEHDGNWLFVAMRARDGARSWSKRDPCLLTYELVSLASWLRCILTTPPEFGAQFLEPNLGFHVGKKTAGGFRVDVHLSHEFAQERSIGSKNRITVMVSEHELLAAITRIEASMLELPARGMHGARQLERFRARGFKSFFPRGRE